MTDPLRRDREDVAVGPHSVVSTAHAPIQPLPATLPEIVTEVKNEIRPGAPTVWEPASYAEWEARERTQTLLPVWAEQARDERSLRGFFGKWIFGLITGQVIAAFGLVVANGLQWLPIDPDVLKVLIPSVLAEVFGLGYLVTKFLFSLPLRQSLDALAHGAKSVGNEGIRQGHDERATG